MTEMRRSGIHLGEFLFRGLCLAAVTVPVVALVGMLSGVAIEGLGRLDAEFITSFPSRLASKAGILPALVGSLSLVVLTMLVAVPVALGASLYLEEYGRRGRIAAVIEVNITNLAGVPSVIYGLLGLEIFVRFLALEQSRLAGALTLALLVMPVIITASREAIRTVPNALREAALGMGATRWSMVRGVVLPMAAPGMITGSILALSRAFGESAPLILVGAATFITFLPDGVFSEYSTLPIQIFNWVSRPQEAFKANAAAGIVVLLAAVLCLNAVAVLLRHRLQRRWN
jgi:phosphate transport system permease protein